MFAAHTFCHCRVLPPFQSPTSHQCAQGRTLQQGVWHAAGAIVQAALLLIAAASV